MSSIKCPSCGLTNWADAPACKRCGRTINPDYNVSNESRGFPTPGVNTYSYTPRGDDGSLKVGLAITSMVLGIAGLVTSFVLIGILMAPFALIFGIVALVKASKKPVRFGGRGFAITGIATSCVSILFVVPLIAAIAIPNILAARRHAMESSAIASLRKIIAAQANHLNMGDPGSCPDLQTLAKEMSLDRELASGVKNGYRFESSGSMASGCEVTATPLSKSAGTRSFYFSEVDGVVRAGYKQAKPADQSDPPLDTISTPY